MNRIVKDLLGYGKNTATAGTAIMLLFPGKGRLKPWITMLKYNCGSTAHTLSIMRPVASAPVKLAANANASQAVVVLASDPGVGTVAGALAANDILVIENNDGSQFVGTVLSVSAGTGSQINVTLTANLVSALTQSNRVWFLGAPGDGHPQYDATASTTLSLGSDDTVAGIAGADRPGDPVVVYSPNTTAAGTFTQVQGAWIEAGRVA